MSNHPLFWTRSPHFPEVVFVPVWTVTVGACDGCKFVKSTPDHISHLPDGTSACNEHNCIGGIWVDEVEAAVRRLEE